jgi:hypothetical protein
VQYISKAVSILMLFSMLLVSCGPVTAVPTVTLMPTETALPANTVTPLPSPTATLSQLESAFVIPTRQSDFVYDSTPNPIATPSLSKPFMQFKETSEQDLLDLIYETNRHSYQNFPPSLDWWSEGRFISSQEPVALLIQEYLYRFPQSPHADRLRWQLAFIDSIMYDGLAGNQYGDEWILAELQKRLNQGETLPDQLETILDQYWFDVAYFQPIENLFGDRKTAWFYVISPQVWDEEEDEPKSPGFFRYGGLFAVVREINTGEFQMNLLENDWSFSSGAGSIFEISDHNKNGIPEIALNLWRHSGTMCAGNFKIFEWHDNTFVDLTKGEIQIGDCSASYEYSFLNGMPSIIFQQFFHPKIPAVYTWNGNYYEFSEYLYSNPIEKWSASGSFSEEAESIEDILSSENAGLSSSQIDFLRYRLGIVYALDSQVSDVKRVLQDLIDGPSDRTRTIYSEFARNFLRYYSESQDLSLACKKSREILDAKLDSVTGDDEEELLGIPRDFTFGPGRLRCFNRDVFKLLIREMPAKTQNVPSELRKNGMNLYYAEKQDINLDGSSDEWLIIFDDGVFAVVPGKSGYDAFELEYFWYGQDVTQYSKVKLSIERWTGIPGAVLTFSTDQELVILNIAEDYGSTELNFDYNVDDIFFSSQDVPAQYQVFHIKPEPDDDEYYDVPWSGYRWDSDHQAFRDDLVEYTAARSSLR